MTTYEELVFRVSADTTRFQNPFGPFQRELEETQRQIAEIQAQAERLDNTVIDVDVRVETEGLSEARAEIAALQAQGDNGIHVNLNIGGGGGGDGGEPAERIRRTFADDLAQFAGQLQATGFQWIVALGKGIAAGGPEAAAAMAGVVILLTGILVEAFAALTTATAGFGAITLGIVSALQDPAIKAAAAGIVAELKATFIDIGEPLQGPFLDAFATVTDAFAGLGAAIAPGVAAMGRIFDMLGAAVTESFVRIGPALNDLLLSAGPALTEIVEEIPVLAKMFADLFDVISTNKEGVALFFQLFMKSLEGFMGSLVFWTAIVTSIFQGVAKAIEWLADTMDSINNGPGKFFFSLITLGAAPLAKMFEAAGDAAGEMGNETADAAKATKAQADAAKHAEEENKKLAERYKEVSEAVAETVKHLAEMDDELMSTRLGQDDALTNLAQTVIDFDEEIKKNDKTLDLHTQAGIDNTNAILGFIKAIDQQRLAFMKAGASAEVANAQFASHIDVLKKHAAQLGLNAKEVDDLVAAYARIPAEQVSEIKLQWLSSDTPEIFKQQLIAQFGQTFVTYIEAQMNVDPASDRLKTFLAHDVDETMFAARGPGAGIMIPAKLDEASLKIIETQLTVWQNTTTETHLKVVLDDYSGVETQLANLARGRTVTITPVMNVGAYNNINGQLNRLGQPNNPGLGPSNIFGGGGFVNGNSAPGTNATQQTITLAFKDDVLASLVDATISSRVAESSRRTARRRTVNL